MGDFPRISAKVPDVFNPARSWTCNEPPPRETHHNAEDYRGRFLKTLDIHEIT